MYVDIHVCFAGFHAVDLDSASVNDLFIPSQVSLLSGFILVGQDFTLIYTFEHQKRSCLFARVDSTEHAFKF